MALLGGDTFNGVSLVAFTLSPAAVAANTSAEQLFNLPSTFAIPANQWQGYAMVDINKPTAQAGLGIAGQRFIQGSPNQIGVTFTNNSAAAITPTAGEQYVALIVW